MAKIKEVIGDLLSALIDETDQVKKMELIDQAEILNTEHNEAVAESDGFEEKYNDLLAKFTARFKGELASKEEVDEMDDEDVDPEVNGDEDEEPDFNNMSFEEAGFTGTKGKGGK